MNDEQKFFIVEGVRYVNNLLLPSQNVTEMQSFPHLKNLPISVFLIGQDDIDLIIARQIRCSPKQQIQTYMGSSR